MNSKTQLLQSHLQFQPTLMVQVTIDSILRVLKYTKNASFFERCSAKLNAKTPEEAEFNLKKCILPLLEFEIFKKDVVNCSQVKSGEVDSSVTESNFVPFCHFSAAKLTEYAQNSVGYQNFEVSNSQGPLFMLDEGNSVDDWSLFNKNIKQSTPIENRVSNLQDNSSNLPGILCNENTSFKTTDIEILRNENTTGSVEWDNINSESSWETPKLLDVQENTLSSDSSVNLSDLNVQMADVFSDIEVLVSENEDIEANNDDKAKGFRTRDSQTIISQALKRLKRNLSQDSIYSNDFKISLDGEELNIDSPPAFVLSAEPTAHFNDIRPEKSLALDSLPLRDLESSEKNKAGNQQLSQSICRLIEDLTETTKNSQNKNVLDKQGYKEDVEFLYHAISEEASTIENHNYEKENLLNISTISDTNEMSEKNFEFDLNFCKIKHQSQVFSSNLMKEANANFPQIINLNDSLESDDNIIMCETFKKCDNKLNNVEIFDLDKFSNDDFSHKNDILIAENTRNDLSYKDKVLELVNKNDKNEDVTLFYSNASWVDGNCDDRKRENDVARTVSESDFTEIIEQDFAEVDNLNNISEFFKKNVVAELNNENDFKAVNKKNNVAELVKENNIAELGSENVGSFNCKNDVRELNAENDVIELSCENVVSEFINENDVTVTELTSENDVEEINCENVVATLYSENDVREINSENDIVEFHSENDVADFNSESDVRELNSEDINSENYIEELNGMTEFSSESDVVELNSENDVKEINSENSIQDLNSENTVFDFNNNISESDCEEIINTTESEIFHESFIAQTKENDILTDQHESDAIENTLDISENFILDENKNKLISDKITKDANENNHAKSGLKVSEKEHNKSCENFFVYSDSQTDDISDEINCSGKTILCDDTERLVFEHSDSHVFEVKIKENDTNNFSQHQKLEKEIEVKEVLDATEISFLNEFENCGDNTENDNIEDDSPSLLPNENFKSDSPEWYE